MIQTEALRLFAEQGYAQTTIEEIADAAAISPRTFFRYFPSKEDVVLWDEYDPLALDLLAARSAGEPLAEAFRAVIRETLGGLYRHDPERLRARIQLASTVPEVRARFLDAQTHGIEELAEWVAEARGARRRRFGPACRRLRAARRRFRRPRCVAAGRRQDRSARALRPDDRRSRRIRAGALSQACGPER